MCEFCVFVLGGILSLLGCFWWCCLLFVFFIEILSYRIQVQQEILFQDTALNHCQGTSSAYSYLAFTN